MDIDATTLEALRAAITTLPIDLAVAYGSRVEGHARSSSDLDVLVVTPLDRRAISRALTPVYENLDICSYTPAEARTDGASVPGFWRRIGGLGVLLGGSFSNVFDGDFAIWCTQPLDERTARADHARNRIRVARWFVDSARRGVMELSEKNDPEREAEFALASIENALAHRALSKNLLRVVELAGVTDETAETDVERLFQACQVTGLPVAPLLAVLGGSAPIPRAHPVASYSRLAFFEAASAVDELAARLEGLVDRVFVDVPPLVPNSSLPAHRLQD